MLLAQESEEFLKGNVKAESGAALASKWRSADRSFQSSLSAKKSYYDEITVDGNCYHACLKLDALRASDFEIGGPNSPVPHHGLKHESRPSSVPGGSDEPRNSRSKEIKANKTGGHISPPSTAGSKRSIPSREAFAEPKNLKKANKVYSQADPRSRKGKDKTAKSKRASDINAPVNTEEFNKFVLEQADQFSPTRRSPPRNVAHQLEENNNAHTSRLDSMIKKKKIEKDLHDRVAIARAKDEGVAFEELQNYQVQQDYEADMIKGELRSATMSKSEREFLNRRGMPDVNASVGPPAFPKPVIHHSLDHFPRDARAPNVDSDSRSEVVNAMRNRITQVEEEVKMMRAKARGAEEQGEHQRVVT